MIKKLALAAAVVGIIVYSISGSGSAASQYAAQLQKFRSEKNRSFRQSPDSPLSVEQKAAFDSLKYYASDAAYVFHCALSRNASPDTVLLQMSDNRSEKYLRWGLASFFPPLDVAVGTMDKPTRLTLFRKADGRDSTLFVPFTDGTNGHETYGGGRYLDVPLPAPDSTGLTLDFNRAYNPYCAYNSDYSCPVPPAENRLTVAIPAGEKSFHE
ncbi:DUF1684 domain-containing protein [Hymenobacter monticola]|uniref:DUF1684 domain-containing protein n=1 Tax=Hymenobacter monticola TaxID=1705399 RepID=A0ABY4BHA1_9BACT|nr:DUF1684 domain-containing protein [Hymenobacter monticola]UOE36010.1 DUF1684 domain-containing protein [Hymenobacter monticola]